MNKERSEIIFIANGTPTPASQGFGSSFLLKMDSNEILLDCGPATTQKLARVGYSPLDINYLFLTHLHFDHCADLPCFLLSYWDQNPFPESEIELGGPAETSDFIDKLIGPEGAFSVDIKARINAPISQNTYLNRGGKLPRSQPAFEIHNFSEQKILKIPEGQVEARSVKHVNPWLNSLAYRFDVANSSVVISGDTGSIDAVADLAKNTDVLVVNCWDAKTEVRNAETDASLATPEIAAKMAGKANAKQLVLCHMGFRSGQQGSLTKNEVINKVKEIYQGRITIPNEGDSLNF